MTDNTTADDETSEEISLTVIKIPGDKLDAVMGFINELESEDSDVSGHMISGGALSGFGGTMASLAKTRTDTGCVQTKTGVGVDFSCSDSDTMTQ